MRPKRSGVALVLFVMLVFALMAVAALVIDLGFAVLSRRQMQMAVNTAALEGLRGRDDGTGRQNASRIAALVFDDDLDPTSDSLNLGAGPVITYTDGIAMSGTSFRASRSIREAQLGVYKPRRSDQTPGLELNADNAPEGDMVSGKSSSGAPVESDDYTRDDFTPAGAQSPAQDIDAFLVRMRRTGETFNAGVGSAGPPVPFLFGRGALLAAEAPASPGAISARRERGTFVRATALAHAERVKLVGPAMPTQNIRGATPFAIQRSNLWDSLAGSVALRIQSNGLLTDSAGRTIYGKIIRATRLATDSGSRIEVSQADGFPAPPFAIRIDAQILTVTAWDAGAHTQWTVDPPSTGHAANSSVALFENAGVGDPILVSRPYGLPLPVEGYVPVYQEIEPGVERIIGFGWASLNGPASLPPDASGYPVDATIQKQVNRVASENASAQFRHLPAFSDPQFLDALLNAHDQYQLGTPPVPPPFRDPLSAPALVRTIR